MIQVVDRIGRVMDAFTPDRPELTLSQCAEQVGLTKSTVHRLLSSLEAIGLVERSGRAWRLGERVVSLAATRLAEVDLRSEAVARLRVISREERAAAALSLPEGSALVYVDRVASPGAIGVGARLGARVPLWIGGSGRAFLAQLTPEAAERRLDDPGFHALPPAARELVREDVAAARERGYCVDTGVFYDGIGGVCVAVPNLAGEPIAVLSVIVPTDRLGPDDAERIAGRLLAARDQLATLLGLRDQLWG